MSFLQSSSMTWSQKLADGRDPNEAGIKNLAEFDDYNAKYLAEQKRLQVADQDRQNAIIDGQNTGRAANMVVPNVNANANPSTILGNTNDPSQQQKNFAKTPGFNPTSIL